MDDKLFQVLLATGVGLVAYKLYQALVSAKPGGAGGLAGVVTDIAVGALNPNTNESVPQPDGASQVPNPNTYYGPPILCVWINPTPGGSVTRQPFQLHYPITLDLKNMTPNVLTGRLTFRVTEGGEDVVVTEGDVISLHPGDRRRVTTQVRTETVFGVSQADCRVTFGALPVGYGFYLIK